MKIPPAQTPEQLKGRNIPSYIDNRGMKWIRLNRGLTNHLIIKDLIKLSEMRDIKYIVIPHTPYSTILIDPEVYDEYMSDILEDE